MMRLVCLLTLLIELGAPTAVSANPVRVANLFANGDPVVVVCAPGTCDSAAEKRLQALGKQLHDNSGARILVAHVERHVDAAVYTEAAAAKGAAPKDVLVATNGTTWSVRSATVPPDKLAALEAELAKLANVEAGVALVVDVVPGLQGNDIIPDRRGVAAGPSRGPRVAAVAEQPAASEPTSTPADAPQRALPFVAIALGVLTVIGLFAIWRRR